MPVFHKPVVKILVLSVILGAAFVGLFDHISRKYIKVVEAQRLSQMTQLVEIARNTIEPVLSTFRSGGKSREQSLSQVRDLVRRMTFNVPGGQNYIFMSTYEGLMLVQPFEPEKEMRNQWDLKDANGVYIIRSLAAAAQEYKEGGFVTYHYTAPASGKVEEKISYVLGIPELGCYIGTGRYMDDLRKQQAAFRWQVMALEILLIVLVVVLSLVSINEIIVRNNRLEKEITIRKQSESELHDREVQLRTLLHAIPDMVWLKDPGGVYLFCNPVLARSLGAREGDILGKRDEDFLDAESAALYRQNDQKAIAGGGPMRGELKLNTDDGDRFLETIKTPMFDNDGKLVGVLGIARDITERKHRLEELRQLRNYLGNIINSMPSVLIGVDVDGRVTQWNMRAEQTTGIHASDAQGKALSHVFPRIASRMEQINKSIRTRQAVEEQKRIHQENEKTCFEDVTIYPLIANGVEGAVIRVDDVTDKVRMEEMVVQSEKMMSIGGLAAGMAHEINNPLAGMLQTADVMAGRLTKPDIPANRIAAEKAGTSMAAIRAFMEDRGIPRMIETIRISGRRASKIVENMLSFARKSSAGALPEYLEELIDTTLALATTDYDLKKKYDFKKIRIRKEYEKDLPPVPCEGSKIQQVLLNILQNGAHAMQTGETAIPTFVLRTRHEADMVCIEIEDNGPGMDEETRKRVFEPFFTTKPVGVGTGLGLSVSYFIITENHDGQMTVDSGLGRGTTFTIRLPLAGVGIPSLHQSMKKST